MKSIKQIVEEVGTSGFEIEIEDTVVDVCRGQTNKANLEKAIEIARALQSEGYKIKLQDIPGDWDGDQTWLIDVV
jgi:hypothetical protein